MAWEASFCTFRISHNSAHLDWFNFLFVSVGNWGCHSCGSKNSISLNYCRSWNWRYWMGQNPTRAIHINRRETIDGCLFWLALSAKDGSCIQQKGAPKTLWSRSTCLKAHSPAPRRSQEKVSPKLSRSIRIKEVLSKGALHLTDVEGKITGIILNAD